MNFINAENICSSIDSSKVKTETMSSRAGVSSSFLAPDRAKFEIYNLNRNLSENSSVEIEKLAISQSLQVANKKYNEMEDAKTNEEEEEDLSAVISTKVTDPFEDFENWLIRNGAEFPDLYLKAYTPTVRGAHAKRHIDSLVCIVSIPLKCIITDLMGRTQTRIGRKLFSSNCKVSSPNLIAVIVYILTTREDPDNFFMPYYRILPKDYSNFPVFWDEEKLSWLQGSTLIDDIIERKNAMRSDYDEICRICPEFSRYSFDEFKQVRTAVGSRNFGIVIKGEKRTAMVPFADMLNHYRPRETSWTFENSKNAFTITSITPLEAGQQVMDSYGKKCNSRFFLHYGFALESNREDDGKCQNEIFIKFSFGSSLEDPLRETKLAFLGSNCGTRCYRLSMNIEDKQVLDAIGFLRVKVATELELNQMIARTAIPTLQQHSRQYRNGGGNKDSNIPFLSCENEAKALEALAYYCSRQLLRYQNSYDENLRLLKSGVFPPFSDRRTALIVVLSEQEICTFWIRVAEVMNPIFRTKSGNELRDAVRALPRSSDTERDLVRYAVSVLPWSKG